MFTRVQLKKQLKLISYVDSHTDKASVVNFDHWTNEKYRAQVECYIKCCHTEKQLDWYSAEWVNKFSMFTDTPWAPARQSTRKDAKFVKIYKCHTVVPHTCKSRITFEMLEHEKSSTKITIKINYLHCRSTVFQKLLSKESPSDYCKNIHHIFYMYFSDCFIPVTAKMYHNLTLVNKFGKKENILSDPAMNPTMSDVMSFFKTWKNLYAEAKRSDEIINYEKLLERKKTEMDAMGVLVRNHKLEMMVLITPTMKRVLTFHNLDVVIVSSTSVPQGLKITNFFVPSKIGALCFSCVLHQKLTDEAYKQVFLSMKSALENDLKKTMNPKSVIVNDSTNQILAIKEVFVNSKVMIAPWSICRDLWTYMGSGKTQDAVCHTTMAAFHDIMHAADAKSAHLRFIKFMSSAAFIYLSIPIKRYLEAVWRKYRLIVWWSSDNNSLIELSVTLLQQLFIQSCESFNIFNMCDVINTLDHHYQQLMMRWFNQKSILKTHSKFLNRLGPELNTYTIKAIPPHQFLLTNGCLQIRVRTDTWCCSCPVGKRSLYCEHLCAIMELADVTFTLTDDERDLLKLIAGENNVSTDFGEENEGCDEDNVHPYSDGYFIFNFPMKVTMQNSVEKERNEILNKKKNANTCNAVRENIHLSADFNPEKTVNKEQNLNFEDLVKEKDETGYDKGIHTMPILQESIKQEEPFHVKDEPLEESMEVDSTNTQNFFDTQEIFFKSTTVGSIKKEITEEYMNIESTYVGGTELFTNKKHETDASEHIIEPKEEVEYFIEIDMESNQQRIPTKAVSNNCSSINEHLSVEHKSQNSDLSENYFDTEYKNAVDSFCAEFKSLEDCLSLSPSTSKLACIMRLTNELSTANME